MGRQICCGAILVLLLCPCAYGTITYTDMKPGTDGTLYLGLAAYQWKTLYSVDGIFSGSIRIGNNKYLGSTGDPDAIQIEDGGDVAFTQDVNVTGVTTMTGALNIAVPTGGKMIDANATISGDAWLGLYAGSGDAYLFANRDSYGGVGTITEQDFVLRTYNTDRLGISSDGKSVLSYTANNLWRSVLMVNTGNGTWQVYEPNGASVDISSSTTDGLDEAFATMVSKRANLWVIGGGKGTGATDDYATILCTTTVTVPPLEGAVVRFDGVRILWNLADIAASDGLVIDSQMLTTWEFNGELVYYGTGTALKFAPSSELYTDPSGPSISQCNMFFNVVVGGGDILVEFDDTSGGFGTNILTFMEINGSIADGYYFYVNASAGKTFAQNIITSKNNHSLTTTANPLFEIRGGNYTYGNEWHLTIGEPNDGTALRTDASNDIYYVDIGAGGADVNGIICDTNAYENYFTIGRFSNAARGTVFTDNSTAKDNILYYDGSIRIGNNKYLGSTGDPDAIQIEDGGDVTFTQDVNVTGVTTVAGDVVVTAAGGGNAGGAQSLQLVCTGQNGTVGEGVWIGFTDSDGGNMVGKIRNLSSAASNFGFQFDTWSHGAQTARFNIGSTGHVMPGTAGSQNFGNASTYWGDISYKTLTDRGCLGWFDEGVELQDGSKVSDVEALKAIKPHKSKKTVYGVPMLDYATMPKAVYKPATKDKYNETKEKWESIVLPRDGNDVPYWCDVNDVKHIAADGAETTALISIMLGAIKEQAAQIENLEKRIEPLEKKVK